MKQGCNNCEHSSSDDWHELTCNNPKSQEYKDYVDDEHKCKEWEVANCTITKRLIKICKGKCNICKYEEICRIILKT